MKRAFRIGGVILVAGVVFFFAPLLPTTTANFGGGPAYTAWVSLSFAFFQCGDFIGHPGIEVPSGSSVNPSGSFWSSFWDCDYPHLRM